MFIVLPTQLFKNISEILKVTNEVVLYEHPEYFTRYRYHKNKLAMHRATLKYYHKYLESHKVKVKYVEFHESIDDICKGKDIYFYDPYDARVTKHLLTIVRRNKCHYSMLESHYFILTDINRDEYFKQNVKKNPFIHNTFYIWCRERFNIFMNDSSGPIGGKWSFDTENRLPFPNNVPYNVPYNVLHNQLPSNKNIPGIHAYIDKHFKNNPGEINLFMPLTHKEAEEQLDDFIKNKLRLFGPYEDAVRSDVDTGYHSVLSVCINVGLLTPAYIIEKVTTAFKKSKRTKELIASTEAYIRQLFWREYCLLLYKTKFSDRKVTDENFFQCERKLPNSWYRNDCENGLPFIKDIINKVVRCGYAHHIERLMYLGNVMLLTDTRPEDAYTWFMEMFIDAYEWVMVPNVYGMSQFSVGPLMMKRPYICSSNYISKMSDYKKKKDVYPKIILDETEYEWYEVLDALFYRFIDKHQDILGKYYSLASIVAKWKKNKNKKETITIANQYLKKY